MTTTVEGYGQSLFTFVRHWSRRWSDTGDSARAERGRTVLAVETVHVIQVRGDVTVNAVAIELGLNQSNASRLLAHATTAGYLETAQSSTDRRQRTITLTSEGQLLLDAAHAWQDAAFATLTTDWTATERAEFSRGMRRLVARSADLDDRD